VLQKEQLNHQFCADDYLSNSLYEDTQTEIWEGSLLLEKKLEKPYGQ